jgi:threonine dehydrogenase-like Zn-dependent dehydrogenase
VGPGDNVAIWGLGPIGLSAVMWAAYRGANQIIGIDSVPSRLSKASQLGATHVINFEKEENIVSQ